MDSNKISTYSRLLLLLATALLVISIFVPIWSIELAAPQYPEGLGLLIFADKIGGDVNIINGLNHYIGMQTLHSENFIEFTILPYVIGAYALFTFLAAIIGRKTGLYILFIAFVLFGIIAMVDFWRWEYNYGHNLDPAAAIIVPGMSYQPPLIGYKQLLNFGAFSVPAIGGWLFIVSGLLMLLAVLLEKKVFSKLRRVKASAMLLLMLPVSVLLYSCTSAQSEPIKLNKDQCDYCKMTIADGKFGCEIATEKGRIYKFDDLGCLFRYKGENAQMQVKRVYINDYLGENSLIDAELAYYVTSNELKSPMGGNYSAYHDKGQAEIAAVRYRTIVSDWKHTNQ